MKAGRSICRRREGGFREGGGKGRKRNMGLKRKRRCVFRSTLQHLLYVSQGVMSEYSWPATSNLFPVTMLKLCVCVCQTPCCQLHSMWPSERLRSTPPWSRGKSQRGIPSLDSPSPNRYLHVCAEKVRKFGMKFRAEAFRLWWVRSNGQGHACDLKAARSRLLFLAGWLGLLTEPELILGYHSNRFTCFNAQTTHQFCFSLHTVHYCSTMFPTF